MKLVKVKSLDGKQLTYGDLEPDTWFSAMETAQPAAYKTCDGHTCVDALHIVGSESIVYKPVTPVRVYKCELHYEAVE